MTKHQNVASKPTPENAKVLGLLGDAELQAPDRALSCPGCGVKHLVRPDESILEQGTVKPGITLHFEFECAECDYSASLGMS